ncbi:MAG: SusC/RagA family TonB-linked outer membrane protein, partial [Alistipes sp.]|nr:SusC/RagA family TonB-linked outer membrane protein [Alistipes sp.]
MRLKISRLNYFSSFVFLLLLSGILPLAAQVGPVAGRVLSQAEGEPVIGAAVVIKGTTTGVTTIQDGTFIIDAAPGSVLTVSCLGYITKDVTVGEVRDLDVFLEEDHLTIDEVVAVGYRTERKANLTGAVSIVKVGEMMSAAENNPIKALQGRVPGMVVSSDGNPSGAATIRIRGEGTFNNNDPLLVIDGVATKGGMHELNSNDIESIQVLKDASAASIYGSRAANGVIIVTTKRGAKGQSKFTFDSYVTGSFYGNRMKVLNARQYGQAMWRAGMYSGDAPTANNIGSRYTLNYDVNGTPVLENILLPQYIDSKRTMLTSDTDWFDEITRTGFMQSYNFSASNGSDNGSYYLSAGYLQNDGLVRYTDFSRFSTRMNSDFKFFGGRVIISENLTVNRTTEVQAPGGILDAALKSLPVIPVHTVSGGWGGPTNGMQDRHNPMRLLYDNKDNNYTFWRIFGNAYLSIEPVRNLILKSSFGVDYGNFHQRTITHSYQTGIIESDKPAVAQPQTHNMKWTWTNTAAWSGTFDRHSVSLLGGFEMYKQEDLDFTAYKDGFIIETPEQMWHNMGIGTSLASGGFAGYSLLSYFGNVGYNFDDRYLASLTVRHDG